MDGRIQFWSHRSLWRQGIPRLYATQRHQTQAKLHYQAPKSGEMGKNRPKYGGILVSVATLEQAIDHWQCPGYTEKIQAQNCSLRSLPFAPMELSSEQKQLNDILDSHAKNYGKFVPPYIKGDMPDGWNESKFLAEIAKLKEYISRPPTVVVRSTSSEKTSCSQCSRYKAKVLKLEEERKKQASYLVITEAALAFGDAQK